MLQSSRPGPGFWGKWAPCAQEALKVGPKETVLLGTKRQKWEIQLGPELWEKVPGPPPAWPGPTVEECPE
jgi:hypothetical protein